jgi:Uma2 family endonuclease
MVPAANLVPVQDYLARTAKPYSEFEDGVLSQKPISTWEHSALQSILGYLILKHSLGLLPGSELHCQIRPGKYLLPDLVAQERGKVQRPHPTEAVALCVEILSPGDTFSEIVAKCEEYHRCGVPTA